MSVGRALGYGILISLGAVSGVLGGRAQAEAVAIVTDIAGKAEVQATRSVAAALLAELAEGARAKLDTGSRMVVLYLRSGEQFSLSGPALVRFGAAAPQSVEGTKPVKLRALTGKDGKPLHIRPVGLTQAATVARSGPGKPVPAVTMASTITLERAPVFRWKEVERGSEYQFVLKDGQGNTIFARQVTGDSLQLPPEVSLREGETYRWSVGTRAGRGEKYRSAYTFRLADTQLRTAAENFRPGEDASMAECVAYAVWLDQAGLRDEGTVWWGKAKDLGSPEPASRPAVLP